MPGSASASPGAPGCRIASACRWKRPALEHGRRRAESPDVDAPRPAVLYALPDRISDYVWLRPYPGAGMTFRQQTLKEAGTSAVEIASERKSGPRVLGGGEMTFSSVPSLALGAEVGYEWPRSTFAGVDAGGPVFSISRALARAVARPTRRRGDVSIEETGQGWALSRSFATSWPAPGSAS